MFRSLLSLWARMTMKQHTTNHNGDDIQWTDREDGLSAMYRGFHVLIERVMPLPEAISDDRVVVAMTRWVYRPLVDGSLADPMREFHATTDAAKAVATDMIFNLVESLAEARKLRTVHLRQKPVRYEDWL